MSSKRPIHPLIQILTILSLLLTPLLTAAPAAADGPVELWIDGMYDSDDPVRAGSTFAYIIEIDSNVVDPSFLEDVLLHVHLPEYVTPIDSDHDFYIEPDGTVVFDIGTMMPGDSYYDEYDLEVQVADDAAALMGGPFEMMATAWLTSNNWNMYVDTDNQDYVTTRVNERADLRVTKVRVPDLIPNFIIAGQTILYEVTVENQGTAGSPSAARNVVLYDWAVEGDPDYNLELVSSSIPCDTLVGAAGSGWFQATGLPGDSGGENVYACPIGTLGAGETRTYQFLYRVPAGMSIASNDIVNFAEALSTNKLVPVVTDDFATPDPDVPPAMWPLSLSQVRTWTWDNMFATADTNVWAAPDISIAKTSWPNPVVAGEKIWYQLTVTNNGPSDADTIWVTDTLPISVTYVASDQATSWESPIPGPDGQDQAVWYIDHLAVGESATAVIEGFVDPLAYYDRLQNAPPEPLLFNWACAWLDEQYVGSTPVYVDPDHANNCVGQYTFLDESADLQVIKMSKPDTAVRAGDLFTYTIFVENLGPSAARDVSIRDEILSSGTFEIVDVILDPLRDDDGPWLSPSPVGGQTMEFDLYEPLEPKNVIFLPDGYKGGRWVIQVVARANEAQDVNNLVNVYSRSFVDNEYATPDPNLSNNTATDFIAVTAVADLSISKSRIDPTTIEIYTGDPLTYALDVANAGPSTAENVVVKEYLPAGVVILNVSTVGGTPFTYTGGTPGDPTDPMVITMGTVPPGWSDQIQIELLVDPSVRGRISGMAQYGFMRNDTLIASDTFDDDWSDNSATLLERDVLNLSYFFVEKSGPTTATAGTEIEYEIFVENRGPSTAFNLRVKDWLGPETLQYATYLGSYMENVEGECTFSQDWGGVFCNVGDRLPHDGFGTPEGFSIYLRFLVDPAAPAGTVMTNTVELLTDNWEWEYITQLPDGSVVDSVLNFETEVTAEANLVANKTSVPQKVVAGEQVKYVIDVTNNGPSDAQNVVLIDHFGDVDMREWEEFEVSSDPACQIDGYGHLNCQWGTLPAGATRSVDVWALVQPDVDPGTIITNRVAVGSDTGPFFNYAGVGDDVRLWENVETYVLNSADLKIQKFGKPDGSVRAGELLTYTIVVDNLGPSSAFKPAVQDMLRSDKNFELVSIDSSRPYTCSVAAPTASVDGALDFVCWLNDEDPAYPAELEPGYWDGDGRWILTVVVTANETQSINNTARVLSESNLETDTANNYAAVEHEVTDVADLSVTKSAVGEMMDPETGAISPVGNRVTAGRQLVYTLEVSNAGPSTAENVVLEDRLPAWVTYVDYKATQGTCDAGTPGDPLDQFTCGLGTVTPGGVVTVVVAVAVPDWVPDGTLLTNDAYVYSDIFDPENDDNYAQNVTAVNAVADLGIAKFAIGTPVAGTVMHYRIQVTNAGPSVAPDVVLRDWIPAGMHVVDTSVVKPGVTGEVPQPCDVAEGSNALFCPLGSVDPTVNDPILVIVDVLIDPSVPDGTLLLNTADVFTTDTADPNLGDNVAQAGVVVQALADLSIVKTGVPEKVYAGEQIRYSLTVTNNGPSDAVDVQVDDAIPADTTFEVTNGECAYDAVGGVADCGYMPVGSSRTFDFWVLVDPDLVPGSTIVNGAAVQDASRETVDPEAGNSADSEDTYVLGKSDLKVTKFGKPDGEVLAGTYLTYTIIVDNLGPSYAWDVTLKEVLRSNLNFRVVSVESNLPMTSTFAAGWYTQTADFEFQLEDALPVAAPDETGRWILTLVVTADETQDINNSVEVLLGHDESIDPDTANNYALIEHDITDVSDLSVTKAAVGEVMDAETGDVSLMPNSVTAGQRMTYTMVVANAGPSTAENVVLQDRLPAWVTFVSYTATQGVCNTGTPGEPLDKLTCGLGTIAPSGVVTVVVVADVPSWVAAETLLTNDALVYSDIFDPENDDNYAQNVTAVSAVADLLVLKDEDPDPVVAGEVMDWAFVVTNNGPSDAVNVMALDDLPDELTFVSADFIKGDGNCQYSEGYGLITCDLGPLAAGESEAVVIRTLVKSDTPDGTVIVNPVIVGSVNAWEIEGTPDFDEENNEDTASTTVQALADLSIVKTGTPQKVYAGEQVKYEYTVTNAGSSDARNVVVSEELPATVAFELTNGDCAYDPVAGEADCGYMAAGTSKSFYVWVRVDADVEPGTTIFNDVSVASDTDDPDESNNATTVGNYVMGKSDLNVVKFGKPDGAVRAGEYLTYTIIVDNLGPSYAWDVTLKEVLRSNLNFRVVSVESNLPMTSTFAAGWYTQAADFEFQLEDALPVAAPDETGRWILTLVVTADETQDINNSVEVLLGHDESIDPDTTNNYALIEHDITDVSDLEVLKSAAGEVLDAGWQADRVTAGMSMVYTMTVTNYGPSTAENIVLEDRIPAWLDVTGYDATQGDCNQGTPGAADDEFVCGLGTLAVGASVTVVVYADVASWTPEGATIENDVHVYSDIFDPLNANNYATNTTRVSTEADLVVEKDEEPDPVVAGEIEDWAFRITNNGPSDAINVVAVDTLPAEVEFLSASVALGEANCTYSAAWHLVTCDLGALAAGESAGVLIRTMVKSSADAGYITNTVAVSSDPLGFAMPTPDPDEDNNVDSTSTQVVQEADLKVEKVGVPEKGYAGEQIRYEITVTNNGSSDARNVTVTDVLDEQVAFELTNGECAYDVDTDTADCGYMAVGTAKSFYIWVLVDADVAPGTTIENTAAVVSDTPDPVTEDNSITIGSYIQNKADLRVTKFGKPDGKVRAGDNLTYTIVVDNLGPSYAWDTTLEEVLRSDGTFWVVSVTSDREANCPIITAPQQSVNGAFDFSCTLEDPFEVMDEEGNGRWIVTVVVTANETQDINNVATVFAEESVDPVPSNNIVTVEHDITDVADLSVVKTEMGWAPTRINDEFEVLPASDSAIAGLGTNTYTLVVRNDGPSTAENVVLMDRLPAYIVVTGYESTQGTCETGAAGAALDKFSCGLGTIAVGGVATVTISFEVPYWVPEGTILENDVLVYSDIYDPDNANNQDTNLTDVYTYADLGVEKYGPATINAGEEIEYILEVRNLGVSTAKEVMLSDILPAPVSFLSYRVLYGDATCGISSDEIGCDLNDMDPGEYTVIAVVGLVSPSFTGVITNTVDVFSLGETMDPYAENNTASVVTVVSPLADLKVTKADSPDPVIAGEMLYYTIVATNDGPSDASGIVVTDTLPTEVTFVNATEKGSYDEGDHTVTWSIGDLAVGESKTVEVHVQVNSDARSVMEGPLADTVVIAGDQNDPDAANNTFVEETFVNDLADLRITKVGKPDGEVRAGQPLVYTIYVDNLGPSDAIDVVVTDNILSSGIFGVSDITASQGTWYTDTVNGNLVFELGNVPAGARVTIGMVVSADETQDVNNIVSVFSAETPDPNYADNQTIVMTAYTAVSDLGITKTVITEDPVAGETIEYQIVVWNAGPSTAENVVVKDYIPAGTVPLSIEGLPEGAQYTFGTSGDPANPAVVNLGTLAPGEMYTATLTLLIDAGYGEGILANDIEIFSDIFDPDNSDNRATAVVLVEPESYVWVNKTDDPDPVLAGEIVEYTIIVNNFGPSVAKNVRVWDHLRNGSAEYLTLVDYSILNGDGTCTYLTDARPLLPWPVPGVLCELGDLQPTMGPMDNERGTRVVLHFRVSPNTPDGFTLEDRVFVDADTSIETDSPYVDAETDVVNIADLSITKTVTPAPVVYTGEGLAYEITVSNAGPGTAFDVQVGDMLPKGISYVLATMPCEFDDEDVLVCSLGDIAPGASASFTIYAKAGAGADPGIVTNEARVIADNDDPNRENNLATADVEIQGKADLKVMKYGKPDGEVWAGDLLTYTIVVDNLGPGDAQGVILSDLMSSDGEWNLVSVFSERAMTPNALSGTFTGDFQFDLALDDSLEVGGRWIITVVAEANDTQDLNNTATVTSDYMDPDTSNNEAHVEHAITDNADLSIAKTSGSWVYEGCDYAGGDGRTGHQDEAGWEWYEGVVAAGGMLEYEIVVSNNGPSTAENVVVIDNLPLGVKYEWAETHYGDEAMEGACVINQTLDTLTCALGNIPAGEQVSINVWVNVPSWMPTGTELWNTARVFSDIYDRDNSNNLTSAETDVKAIADVAVHKASEPETGLPWQEIVYTVVVENYGPSDAPGTRVVDTVPTGIIGVEWTAEFSGGATGRTAGAWVIDEIVDLPAGSRVVYTLRGMLDTYWPITNTVSAMVAEGVWDPCEGNSTYSLVNAPKLNFLPIQFKEGGKSGSLPNLRVERIIATPNAIQVEVKNVGDWPVQNGFWVDLYINPPSEPTKVNQIWNDPEGDGTFCAAPVCQGLAWGVDGGNLPLAPGETLILRVDDGYSNIPWPLDDGAIIYAQADSWDPTTDYGTVMETHELYGGAYDNIRLVTRADYTLDEGAGNAAIADDPSIDWSGLPERP